MPDIFNYGFFRRAFGAVLSLFLTLAFVTSVRLDARAQASPGDAAASVGVSAALAAREEALKRNLAAKNQPAVTGQNTSVPSATDTPPPAITDANVSKPGFEGKPLTYSIDLSTMVAGGNTNNGFSNPPGGMDASLIYKIDRTTRVTANYYQFSATPLGNDDTRVPVLFQGTQTPIGYVNLNAMRVDPTTHLRFQLYNVQQMFFVGGRHHPLVIAPSYLSIRSSIGGKDDVGTIWNNGHIITSVHQRSYENESLNLAIPLFYGEKYLISYTGGGIRNVAANGANRTNNIQYIQSGYAQYQPSPELTLFANVVGAITYFPTDAYPYHSPTFHYGISKSLKSPFFIEAEVSTGGPTNPDLNGTGRIGIPDLRVPCPATAAGHAPNLACATLANDGVAVPFVGAQRFTTFTLLFGYGANPLVRPF